MIFRFRNSTACGTLDYLAPEIVGHQQYQYQVDNWCVGVLAFELLSGHAPFEGNDDETKRRIASINYSFPDYFSPLARRFIENVNKSIERRFLSRRIFFSSFSFYKKIRRDECRYWIVSLILGYRKMRTNICLDRIYVQFMLIWKISLE